MQKIKPVKRKIRYVTTNWDEDEVDEFVDDNDDDFIDGEGDPESEMLIDQENSGDNAPPAQQIKKST